MIRAAKRCPRCEKTLPTSEFYLDKSRPDGLTAFCKPCKRVKQKRYADEVADKDRQKRRVAEYYQKNKAKIDAKQRERRANNKHLSKPRTYTPEQLERKASYAREHYQRNKEAYLASWGRRRAAKAERSITLTKEQRNAIRAIYKEARRLTEETGEQWHVDHIMPLQGENASGLHVPWNLRVITAKENLSKGNAVIPELAIPVWKRKG